LRRSRSICRQAANKLGVAEPKASEFPNRKARNFLRHVGSRPVPRDLPKSLPEPAGDAINRPVIRIASVQQPPERIIIDTSQPTIIPPPTLVGDPAPSEPSSRLQSYASAAWPATVVRVDQKMRKMTKRQGPRLRIHQPPLATTPAVASGSSSKTAPPARLSFTDFISMQLGRNLFNLN
jgi:hypothetical protein